MSREGDPHEALDLQQGAYSNTEIKFQYIPGCKVNLKDISIVVYDTSVAINMLSSIYSDDGTFGSHSNKTNVL